MSAHPPSVITASRPWAGRALKVVAVAAVVIGMANFYWFVGESLYRYGGGNALFNGSVVGGHYYIYEKDHGSLVEVAHADWDWSRLHALTVQITFPITLAAMAYLAWRDRRRSLAK